MRVGAICTESHGCEGGTRTVRINSEAPRSWVRNRTPLQLVDRQPAARALPAQGVRRGCPADDHPAPSRLHPRADQGRCAPEWLAARDRTRKDLLEVKLRKCSGYTFHNTSQYTLPSLTGDSANVRANLLAYIDGFSDNIRDVFTPFGFEEQIQRLDDAFGAVPFVAWPVTCSR